MSVDMLAIATQYGTPASYIAIGIALYKVYNRIVSAETYAKRANHNSSVLLKAMIRLNLLGSDELKEMELNGK